MEPLMQACLVSKGTAVVPLSDSVPFKRAACCRLTGIALYT
jgi:hypothetical protein